MAGKNDDMILNWIGSRREEMLDLLAKLVSIDSGSYYKAGIDRVGEEIRAFLEAAGVQCEYIRDETYGDILRAEVPAPGANERPILLMGHRDTVFANGEASRRPFRIEGARAYGPGVADMKSGLVMNAFVLAAFARLGGGRVRLAGLFTGDEEIGSPFSRPHIEAAARQASVVLNSEPGRASGNVVTGRRGCIFIRFEIFGRSAHSGVNFTDGVSAIEEAARKTQALHALTDPSRSVTVNVGKLNGGRSVNTIAPYAVGEVDLRYVQPQDRQSLLDAVDAIFTRSDVADTRCEYSIFGEFPPMHESENGRKLFELYRSSARRVGLSLNGEFTNGAADSGFAAAVGATTLCGLGPVGGRAHSEDEYIEIDSVVPRAQALAQTILYYHDRKDS